MDLDEKEIHEIIIYVFQSIGKLICHYPALTSLPSFNINSFLQQIVLSYNFMSGTVPNVGDTAVPKTDKVLITHLALEWYML